MTIATRNKKSIPAGGAEMLYDINEKTSLYSRTARFL